MEEARVEQSGDKSKETFGGGPHSKISYLEASMGNGDVAALLALQKGRGTFYNKLLGLAMLYSPRRSL